MKHLLLVVGFMIFFCKSLWSFPFLPLSQLTKKHDSMSHEKKINEEDRIDFSGHWKGECNHKRVEDLVSSQKQSSISLSYGGIKEKYPIGELN